MRERESETLRVGQTYSLPPHLDRAVLNNYTGSEKRQPLLKICDDYDAQNRSRVRIDRDLPVKAALPPKRNRPIRIGETAEPHFEQRRLLGHNITEHCLAARPVLLPTAPSHPAMRC